MTDHSLEAARIGDLEAFEQLIRVGASGLDVPPGVHPLVIPGRPHR